MKNCLLYTSCLQRGGTERIVCVYSGFLKKKGCQVSVLTNFRLEEEYGLEEGVERIVVGECIKNTASRVYNYIQRLRAIRRVCREKKIEVAIAFAKANAIRLCIATLGLKTRVVISIRTNPEAEFQPGISSKIAKKIFGLADGFLFQTGKQRDFFGKKIAAKSVVIPNSIDKSFLKEPYSGERDNRIITVGRLIACKNHKMLMRAFAQIAPEFPDMQLVIYGDGGYKEELEKEREKTGFSDRILLPGAVSQVADVIQNAGMFVLSSDYEGMPNALLEAMALGIPSISTDCPCGGPAEIIQNGRNGLLISVGDTDGLANAMRTLLSDKAMQKRFSEEGIRVQQDYSEEKTFEALYRYLEKVVQG